MTTDPTLFASLCGHEKVQAAQIINLHTKLIIFDYLRSQKDQQSATKRAKHRAIEHPDYQLCLLHR